MSVDRSDLKAFALLHDPEKRVLYEVDAAPTGSTVRMTNLAHPVDDPAGVTRMDVGKATATLDLIRGGVNVTDFASVEEFGPMGIDPR